MINDTFSRRFQELDDQFETLGFEVNQHGGKHYWPGPWQQWATSCQNLIKAVYGTNSPQYENLTDAVNRCHGAGHTVDVIRGVFLSAKEDFDGGYIFNVDLAVSGEVFGDFVILAKQALAEGNKDAAAVLASAALEDALKRYATVEGLTIDENSMSEVINALKSKGLLSGPLKSLLGTMPKIRNNAMHANWDKISNEEVGSMLGLLEQFLVSKFSI